MIVITFKRKTWQKVKSTSPWLLSAHNIKSSISNTHRLRKRSGFGTVIQRNNPFMENVNATDSSNNSSKNCSPCCYPPKRTKIRHWKNEVQEKGSSVFKHGESSLFSLKRILPYENGDQNLKIPITRIYNVKLCKPPAAGRFEIFDCSAEKALIFFLEVNGILSFFCPVSSDFSFSFFQLA